MIPDAIERHLWVVNKFEMAAESHVGYFNLQHLAKIMGNQILSKTKQICQFQLQQNPSC